MKNDTIGRIFENLDKLTDGYADLPETVAAENRFWKYVNANYIKDAGCRGRSEIRECPI